MHRIDTPTAMIDKFGQGKNGFTNGDTTSGRRATQLTDSYWDAIQEEVCTAIESAGIVLDKSKHNQLSLAIKAIIDDNALLKANNLSDVNNKNDARKNLDIYSKSEGDGRYLIGANNLWGISSAETARNNLGLGSSATATLGVYNGQVMTVNARYPSANNFTTAFMSNNTPSLAGASSTTKPALEISNNGNKGAVAAVMFHREGEFATFFGLDVDNALAIGGYSLGNTRYRIYHEGFKGDLSTQSDAQNRANLAEENAKNYAYNYCVQNIRFGALETTTLQTFPGGYQDQLGYVITRISNDDDEGVPDIVGRRTLQMNIGGNWRVVGG